MGQTVAVRCGFECRLRSLKMMRRRTSGRGSETHLAQFAFEFHLELLQVGG